MSVWDTLLNNLNTNMIGAFGRAVAYTASTGDRVSIKAVVETTKETQESTPGVYAYLFLRLADLPWPPERGDTVAIDNARFRVFDIEADGGGGAVLRLRQV